MSGPAHSWSSGRGRSPVTWRVWWSSGPSPCPSSHCLLLHSLTSPNICGWLLSSLGGGGLLLSCCSSLLLLHTGLLLPLTNPNSRGLLLHSLGGGKSSSHHLGLEGNLTCALLLLLCSIPQQDLVTDLVVPVCRWQVLL